MYTYRISILYHYVYRNFLYVRLRPTHPTPGTEPGARMRCAISSMSSVSATLDTLPRIAPNSSHTRN